MDKMYLTLFWARGRLSQGCILGCAEKSKIINFNSGLVDMVCYDKVNDNEDNNSKIQFSDF